MEKWPGALSSLPEGFAGMTPEQQQRYLLSLKAADAGIYLNLRDTAIRCAPTH